MNLFDTVNDEINKKEDEAFRKKWEKQKKKKKKKDRKEKIKRIQGVIDNNPVKIEESDTESEESDTDDENANFDIVVEPNKRQQEIMNIAGKNKIMEEDEDRSDMMSVYSRRVIGNPMNKRDDETSSMRTVNTATLSRYSVMMHNNNISVPNIKPVNVIKKGKSPMRVFNRNSYYMVINNATDYYVDDEFKIYASGFNDNVYCFTVRKGSDIVEYTLQKPDPNTRSPRYDVVYKINGKVFTIVETVK
jgi:hypothetical protein